MNDGTSPQRYRRLSEAVLFFGRSRRSTFYLSYRNIASEFGASANAEGSFSIFFAILEIRINTILKIFAILPMKLL
jgi:hypothetical protein